VVTKSQKRIEQRTVRPS